MSAVAGPQRVGLRICPGNPFNDLTDVDPTETFDHLLEHVGGMGLAYLRHASDARCGSPRAAPSALPRPVHDETDGYDGESATATLAAGDADLVSFGRHFISNPDLVERLRAGSCSRRSTPRRSTRPAPRATRTTRASACSRAPPRWSARVQLRERLGRHPPRLVGVWKLLVERGERPLVPGLRLVPRNLHGDHSSAFLHHEVHLASRRHASSRPRRSDGAAPAGWHTRATCRGRRCQA